MAKTLVNTTDKYTGRRFRPWDVRIAQVSQHSSFWYTFSGFSLRYTSCSQSGFRVGSTGLVHWLRLTCRTTTTQINLIQIDSCKHTKQSGQSENLSLSRNLALTFCVSHCSGMARTFGLTAFSWMIMTSLALTNTSMPATPYKIPFANTAQKCHQLWSSTAPSYFYTSNMEISDFSMGSGIPG